MIIRYIKTVVIATVIFASCKKEDTPAPPPLPPNPEIEFIDLGGKEIKQQAPAVIVDFNKDGKKDLIFGTMLVIDAINNQHKFRFLATSDIETRLPVNSNEEVPVMDQSATIPLDNFNGFTWYELSSIILVQKITGWNVPVFWEGNWKTATRKYLPVQVIKNNQRFNGWVELSVDITNEKIVLHKAAISKVGEKEIKVGSL